MAAKTFHVCAQCGIYITEDDPADHPSAVYEDGSAQMGSTSVLLRRRNRGKQRHGRLDADV